VGVLTDQDIAHRLNETDSAPTLLTAGLLLADGKDCDGGDSRVVHGISQNAAVDQALQRMTELRLDHLAVHDEDYLLVGVVSRADMEQAVRTDLAQARREHVACLFETEDDRGIPGKSRLIGDEVH
jgi:CBS-domain-containing membrane protein